MTDSVHISMKGAEDAALSACETTISPLGLTLTDYQSVLGSIHTNGSVGTGKLFTEKHGDYSVEERLAGLEKLVVQLLEGYNTSVEQLELLTERVDTLSEAVALKIDKGQAHLDPLYLNPDITQLKSDVMNLKKVFHGTLQALKPLEFTINQSY